MLRLPPLLALALALACPAAAGAEDAPVAPPSPPAAAPPPAAPPPAAPPPAAPPHPAAARPRAVVDRAEHDFGAVRQQTEHTTTFTLRNEGDAPLHVSGTRSECGCMVSRLSSKEIPPGGSATLTVAFQTYTFVGPLTKHVHVTTDDPDRPTIAIQLRIDVSAGIVVSPTNFFFPPALAGASPTATVRVQYREGLGEPFRVLSVDAANLTPAGLEVAFDSKPFDAPPWHGYEITMRFGKPPPVGLVSGTAMIRTDDPRAPRLQALLGGAVSGRVRIGLLQPSFGVLLEGKGGHLQIPVRPFDATVDLGEVTAAPRKGRVQATVERDPKEPGAWILHLRVPPDAAPGAIDDVVEVRTSVQGEEVTALPVSGSVAKRA